MRQYANIAMTGKKGKASDTDVVYRCPEFEIRRLASGTANDTSDVSNGSFFSIVATNNGEDTTRAGTLSCVAMVGQDSFLVAPAHIFMPHPPEEPEEEADDSELDSGSEPLRAGSATPPDLDSEISPSKDCKGMLNGIVQAAPAITLEENFERPNSTPPSPGA